MEISVQAKTFLVILATGALLGLIFDFYRVLRGIFKPRWFVTGMADFSYWLIATVVVAVALLLTNWGELRLYVFIGLIVGTYMYYRLLSRHTMHLLINAVRLVAAIVGYIRLLLFYVILKPLLLMSKVLSTPVRFVGKRLFEWSKKPPDENIPPPE